MSKHGPAESTTLYEFIITTVNYYRTSALVLALLLFTVCWTCCRYIGWWFMFLWVLFLLR